MSDDLKASKGLELPVVSLPCVGHMPAKGEDEQEAARVFYVAAKRATRLLVIGVGMGVWAEPDRHQMRAITSTRCLRHGSLSMCQA